MAATYDTIGVNYAALRRPDPRIEAAIREALGPARSVVNVGAGTGSYEPRDLAVTAVEPSARMIAARPSGSAPAVQADAERLPFPDDSFDAALAILTVHHWQDKRAGLEELSRVARDRVVVVTFDPAVQPWLTDYIPELAELDRKQMPAIEEYERVLGPLSIAPLRVPKDCLDGFLHAYWARPEAYLDPHVRSGSSSFWMLDNLGEGLERLERDLASGRWTELYGHLLNADSYDAGYRIVTARCTGT